MLSAAPPQPLPALVRPQHGAAFAELFLKPRTKLIEANGLRFVYKEWGDPAAPLVLCLHGFPDSPDTWNHLGPALARQGYRVVAPWTRGYYPTETAPDGDDTARALGSDALALIAALGADSAVVIGHDWGALAAYAAVTLGPTHVSKLVAVAIPHPSAISPDAAFGRANHFLTLPLPGAARAFAANDVSGVDRIIAKWSPTWHPSASELDEAKRSFRAPGGTEAILGYYRSFMRASLAASFGREKAFAFASVQQPTLLVEGTEDGAVEQRFYALSRPFFKGSFTLMPLPGVGHFPQREQPERFDQAVIQFLGAAPRRPAK